MNNSESKLEGQYSDYQAIFLWDIDGTLLNTKGIGFQYLNRATFEVTGKELELGPERNHGLTDFEIVMRNFSKDDLANGIKLDLTNRVIDKYVRMYQRAPEIHNIVS